MNALLSQWYSRKVANSKLWQIGMYSYMKTIIYARPRREWSASTDRNSRQKWVPKLTRFRNRSWKGGHSFSVCRKMLVVELRRKKVNKGYVGVWISTILWQEETQLCVTSAERLLGNTSTARWRVPLRSRRHVAHQKCLLTPTLNRSTKETSELPFTTCSSCWMMTRMDSSQTPRSKSKGSTSKSLRSLLRYSQRWKRCRQSWMRKNSSQQYHVYLRYFIDH